MVKLFLSRCYAVSQALKSKRVGIVHGSALAAGEIAANTRLMEQAFALGKALV